MQIAALMESEANREQWRRYVYLTKDFDTESDQLLTFDPKELGAVEIPEGWSASAAVQKFREELVEKELADDSPFDKPQPPVEFRGRSFIFTGNFAYGSRKACQEAVIERGGRAPSQKFASREIDYLVVGNDGSKTWKRGSYGNKIESAILARREYGTPAIISEEHWVSSLKEG